MGQQDAKARLELEMQVVGLPEPTREYRFHPVRKWRFDYCWPDVKVAAEFEGGVHIGGRHSSGGGFEKDCEKYNSAALLGWRVLRFTNSAVRTGQAIRFLQEMLQGGMEEVTNDSRS
jgi:very-short-patch-repair endonuclease